MPAAGKMETKYVFWFTFLVLQGLQVSCERKRSLTFVIDNSLSMKDDINYVRNGAKSIMDIVLNEKSSLIEDIVLVTFNDPDSSFRKRTSNEAELKTAIDDIRLVGNWDCPEMSLSGIKLGLEESLPGSFLYVFTDASAKDHHKYEDIKNLCQEKHIQIVSIVTGKCPEDITHPENSKVYDKIAAACNGQVFRINKENVGEILNYVRETIKGEKSVITSTLVHPTQDSDSYVYFNIDDKTEYALVSTSGSDVSLKVQKETETSNTYNDISGEKVTWTKNAKVLKLANITPGRYRAVVRGSSDVNVMVFGRTDFNFDLGFSNKPESSLKSTETQPTIGAETYLIISVKDDENSVNIKNVELLDMQEKVVKSLPLSNAGGNVYTTEKFLPPNVMFKVAVNAAASKTGKPIRRIAKTPVQPIKPAVVEPEIADTEKKMKASEGSPVNIQCRIRNGKPKPQVTWYFKPRGATEFALMKDETDEVLRVRSAAARDAGEYKCAAENSAGRKEHVTQLEVDVVPAFVETPSFLKPSLTSNVEIPCKISKGSPRPTVKWQFRSTDGVEFQNIDNTGENLKIANVQPGHSGFYKCRAQNAVGSAERIIQVIVVVPPKIEKENVNFTKVIGSEGSDVSLDCGNIVGSPPHTIKWTYMHLGSSTAYPLTAVTGSKTIKINSAKLTYSGVYTCIVGNEAGFDEHAIEVTIQAAQKPEDFPKNITAKESSSVHIDCNVAEGSQQPTVSWFFKANNANNYEKLTANTATLELTNVQGHDSGHYRCEADTTAGAATQDVELIVEVLPEFEKTPATITKLQNTLVTIDCKLEKGNPRPRITWQFRAVGSPTFNTLGYSGEEMRLPSAQLKESGEYKCVAENSAGRDEKTTLVTVLAPTPPEIDASTPSTVKAKENANVSVHCGISQGFPKPTVTWWYKDVNSTDYVIIPSNEEYLRIENIQMNKAGHYKCVLRNTEGDVEKEIQIIVEAPPRIVTTPSHCPFYEGVEGDVVMKVPCIAVGYPNPNVTWVVDQTIVGNDKTKTMYVEDGVLYLNDPDETQSSNRAHSYVCHASNEFGEDKQSYEIIISKYADYENPEKKYGEIGKPYTLKCPLLYTDPNSVRWFVDTISNNKTGPSLHFKNPNQADDGNYTCRVSDFAGAASYTEELEFGNPPSMSKLVHDEEWYGEENEITCKAAHIPLEGKYEWYYGGEKIKEADDAQELKLSVTGWGQYVCCVTNPLGTLNITFNVHAEDCIIDRSLFNTKNLPLVLDMTSSSWPSLTRKWQYQIVPKSEKLTLICEDESPRSKSKTQSNINSFVKFPNTKSVTAVCDHEDLFLVDGVSYKFSEFDCKEEVPSRVIHTEECLGSGTMMTKVGFFVNGFLEVYKYCLDTKRNVALYTEVTTTGADSMGYTDEPLETCKRVENCCYKSVHLVNAADVSAGPAEKATLREPLNSVPYCMPHDENTTSWHDIETRVRSISSSSQLVVWSGAVNYTTVGNLQVPQYLWKVVKDLETEEVVAIVHSNEPAPRANVCESVCDESSWFEPYGGRTYCCKLDEFKRIFNLPIKF